MARKPLTEAQMKARTAKAKATREAKKNTALELMGITPTKSTKVRKKRNLTAAQKAAARERLAKARAERGPSENKFIDEYVRNLPADNPLSLDNVRQWIKENKQQLSSLRGFGDSKDSKERDQYNQIATYIANLETYLRTGVYLDSRYGSQGQNTIKYRVTHMAYYRDGTPKRTVGWMYPDVGIWTEEMENA